MILLLLESGSHSSIASELIPILLQNFLNSVCQICPFLHPFKFLSDGLCVKSTL